MARRRATGRFPALRQGQRRETIWIGGVTVRTIVAAASTAVLQTSLNATALSLRPFTIVRTRGLLRLESDQSTASEFQDAAYGKAVVSDQAVLAGAPAIPTPTTDDASDLWFVYERMLLDITLGGGGLGTGNPRPNGMERIIDSRAMRKVEDGQDIVGVVETGVLSDGVVITSFVRTLVKLH